VVNGCKCDIRSNLVAKILEHCTVKILCIIDCDVSGDPVSADNVLPEEFLDCCGAYICERLHFYPFHEVFNCHHNEGVIALS
jgi:hypothetical protein